MKKHIFLATAIVLLVFASMATFGQSQIEWIRPPTVAWETGTSLTTQEIFDESQLVLPGTADNLKFSEMLNARKEKIGDLSESNIFKETELKPFVLKLEKIDPSDLLFISSGTETCQKIFEGKADIIKGTVSDQDLILPEENFAINKAFEFHPLDDLSEEMFLKISKINGTEISKISKGTQITFIGCQKLIKISTKTTIKFGETTTPIIPTQCNNIIQCMANIGKIFSQQLAK